MAQIFTQPNINLIVELDLLLAQNKLLRPQNRKALEVMRQWLSEPDEDGETWWDEFDTDLQENRFDLTRQ